MKRSWSDHWCANFCNIYHLTVEHFRASQVEAPFFDVCFLIGEMWSFGAGNLSVHSWEQNPIFVFSSQFVHRMCSMKFMYSLFVINSSMKQHNCAFSVCRQAAGTDVKTQSRVWNSTGSQTDTNSDLCTSRRRRRRDEVKRWVIGRIFNTTAGPVCKDDQMRSKPIDVILGM